MDKKNMPSVKSKFLIIGGLFMVTISLLLIWKEVEKKQITDGNRIVTATVIKTPADCNDLGSRGGYYTLKFNDIIFVKRGDKNICESIVGKKEVKVLTNEKMDEIVWIDEYEEIDIWSGFLLVFIGSVISFKGYRSLKHVPTNYKKQC